MWQRPGSFCCSVLFLLLMYRGPHGDPQQARNVPTVVWGRCLSVVWLEVYLCFLQEYRNDSGLGSQKGNECYENNNCLPEMLISWCLLSSERNRLCAQCGNVADFWRLWLSGLSDCLVLNNWKSLWGDETGRVVNSISKKNPSLPPPPKKKPLELLWLMVSEDFSQK